MKVYWTPYNESRKEKWDWINIAYSEPESAYKSIISSRDKQTEYFQCPGVQEYFKNTFVVRAPVDLTITYENGVVVTKQYDQEFFDDYVTEKTNPTNKYRSMVLGFNYVFYSDESCLVEELPAFMEDSELQRSVRVIPGTFDISKWIRPVQFSFEIVDGHQPVTIKRGDPMFYIRFIPSDGSKVSLERIGDDQDIHQMVCSSVNVKNMISHNSLKQNYEMAKSYIKMWKNRRKPNKCPFHFWK